MAWQSSQTKAHGIGSLGYLTAVVIAALLLTALQFKYWRGEYGHASVAQLESKIRAQEIQNEKQRIENEVLIADVADLKKGSFGIEEHARLNLGLIKPGEIFVQFSNAPITYIRQAKTDDAEVVEQVDEPNSAELIDADKPNNP